MFRDGAHGMFRAEGPLGIHVGDSWLGNKITAVGKDWTELDNGIRRHEDSLKNGVIVNCPHKLLSDVLIMF
jgi:hypothetical protein